VLDFSVAPILLGFVLGPMVEENFRRALLLSRGDLMVFVQRPISAAFVALSVMLVTAVAWSSFRSRGSKKKSANAPAMPVVDGE